MNAVTSAQATPGSDEIGTLMTRLGQAAVAAARVLANTPSAQKNEALQAAAQALRTRQADILAANDADMQSATERQLSNALLDRLKLDAKRVETMARGLEEIMALPDPIGATIADWTRPNGLRITRVRVPLGVIGIIYE